MTENFIILSLNGVMDDSNARLNDIYILNDKVKMLKDVCNEVGAKVCILGENTRERPENAKFFYDRMFRHLGLKQGIHEFYPNTQAFLGWLIKHSDSKYVILSADNNFRKSTERQVIFTNHEYGLLKTDVEKIKQYFNPRW